MHLFYIQFFVSKRLLMPYKLNHVTRTNDNIALDFLLQWIMEGWNLFLTLKVKFHWKNQKFLLILIFYSSKIQIIYNCVMYSSRSKSSNYFFASNSLVFWFCYIRINLIFMSKSTFLLGYPPTHFWTFHCLLLENCQFFGRMPTLPDPRGHTSVQQCE